MPLRALSAAALAAGALALASCADQYGRHGYGHARVSVGYGHGGGWCDPWLDPWCGGGAWADPWWGWHDGFFYPGVGIWVFDSRGRRHRLSDRHLFHWDDRRRHWPGRDWNDRRWERWDGFRRDRDRRWDRDRRRWRN